MQRFNLAWPGRQNQGWGRATPPVRRGHPYSVIGAMADVKHGALEEEARDQMYFPYDQVPENGITLAARSAAGRYRRSSRLPGGSVAHALAGRIAVRRRAHRSVHLCLGGCAFSSGRSCDRLHPRPSRSLHCSLGSVAPRIAGPRSGHPGSARTWPARALPEDLRQKSTFMLSCITRGMFWVVSRPPNAPQVTHNRQF